MRQRVIGTASKIIGEARSLGLLARPTYNEYPYMVGCAYDVSGIHFQLWDAGDGKSKPIAPSPEQMTMPWELVTKAIVIDELRIEREEPW